MERVKLRSFSQAASVKVIKVGGLELLPATEIKTEAGGVVLVWPLSVARKVEARAHKQFCEVRDMWKPERAESTSHEPRDDEDEGEGD